MDDVEVIIASTIAKTIGDLRRIPTEAMYRELIQLAEPAILSGDWEAWHPLIPPQGAYITAEDFARKQFCRSELYVMGHIVVREAESPQREREARLRGIPDYVAEYRLGGTEVAQFIRKSLSKPTPLTPTTTTPSTD